MSAPDLDDLHTQSGGLHSLLWMLYEASTDLDYSQDGPGFDAACRVSNLLILARDEAERLDANIGECITGQKRERTATVTVTAPQVDDVPIFEPAKLSMFGLFSLYQAIGTVFDVVTGLANEPRFRGGDTDVSLPPAGDMLQALGEFLAGVRDRLYHEAVSRPMETEMDRQQKLFFLSERIIDGLTDPQHAMAELKKEVAKIGGTKPVRMTGGRRNG